MSYDRKNPYLAMITERYLLTAPDSGKETYHIEVDLSDSNQDYRVGDSFGIYCNNETPLVESILRSMAASGEEEVCTKKGEKFPFREFLTSQANIDRCSRRLLERLTEPREDWKEYLAERQVWDLLEEHAHSAAALSPQEFTEYLGPLLPRYYSVASSPLVAKERVDFTVAVTQYTSNQRRRLGVCSHYLCHEVPLREKRLPLYLQPARDFHLPEDDSSPLIMIGPGTGVAPFRGFMQERVARGATGRHWLFFGEWRREKDFFYEEYWNELVAEGYLRLSTAFSRDQEEKIYVQDRMWEEREELYSWLEEGAYLYVCGDAAKMAKGVDEVLHRVVGECGSLSAEEAKSYVSSLKKRKRYLRDVY